MTSNMQRSDAEAAVRRVLANLTDDNLKALVDKILELGIEDIQDLHMIVEEDLTSVVTVIQARKLVRAWKSAESRVPEVSNPPALATIARPTTSNIDIDLTFDDDVQKVLDRGEKLNPSMRTAIVRVLVKRVIEIVPKPSKDLLSIIATRMVEKYPNSYSDKVGNTELPSSSHGSLLKQLINRRDNKCRNPQLASLKREIANKERQEDEEPIVKIQKKKPTDSYGCLQWQPHIPAFTEGMLNAKNALKDTSKTLEDTWNMETVTQQMLLTYPFQRQALNAFMPLADVKDEWPVLFTKCGLLQHFQTLMGFDCKDRLVECFRDKSGKILAFAREKSAISRDLFAKMEECSQRTGDNSAYIPGTVSVLMLLLKEDIQTLFYVREMDGASNVPDEFPVHPCMLAYGDCLLSGHRFEVVVEHHVVAHTTSFLEGLCCLLASFYVFNLKYPAEASATLDFMQRFLLKINPEKGTKTTPKKAKKISGTHPRVLTLMQQMTDFEWTE